MPKVTKNTPPRSRRTNTVVSSTCLRRVAHDADTQTLELEFRKSGAVYEYYDVPTRVATNLRNAGSVGRHFNRRVRDVYDYQRTRSGYSSGKRKRRRR